MSIFHQQPTKRCKCSLASALKDAFSKCHSFRVKLPPYESEEATTNFEEEEEIFVSEIISKYMELKSKRKWSNIDSCWWDLSPAGAGHSRNENDGEEMNMIGGDDEFFSAGSRLSSADAFVSAKTCLSSRCSSLSRIEIDLEDESDKRRAIILELIHCRGWPFGLCRKALLLPPLPKSPSDSWLWTKSGRIIKIN